MAIETPTLDRVLICKPFLSPRIWGGRRLENLGKNLPPDELFGESWEVADIDEGTSSIINLDDGELPLSEAIDRFGKQLLLGSDSESYPLLIKFLDVHQDTSIQVHPDAETCRRFFPDEKPKTETWVVIEAEPGATLLHDLVPGCTHAKFAWHARNGSVTECLREVEVEAGSVIHVPAGTVHALQPSMMLLEVQQPSDSTFRLDDQGRLGDDGEPRELHVEEAIQATTVADDRPAIIEPERDEFEWGTCEVLVDCGPYRMHRLTLEGKMSWTIGPARSFAASLIDGEVEVRSRGWSGRLSRGATALIPADIGEVTVQPREPSTIIVAEPAGQ